MISIPEEINEKLKREENASGLITQLLTNYYKFNVNKVDEIESRQKEIEEARKKFIEQYSEDFAILEKKKQIIKQEQMSVNHLEMRKRERETEFERNVKIAFKEEMDREMKDFEWNDFLGRWEKGEKGFGIFVYIDEIKNPDQQKDKLIERR